MKKFYSDVAVIGANGEYTIELDGRTVKTPSKQTLAMPTKALAEAVATEWRDQGEDIDAESMPLTKLANTTLDRVKPRFDQVAMDILNFAETDLVCYRADDPAELTGRQSEVWDPYLDWLEAKLGTRLEVTQGIMPVKQDQEAIRKIGGVIFSLDPWELTAMHELVNGFGSIVLALAFMNDHASFDAVWQASILDQIHQEEAWGLDYEAEEKRQALKADLKVACIFLSQVRNKIAGQSL